MGSMYVKRETKISLLSLGVFSNIESVPSNKYLSLPLSPPAPSHTYTHARPLIHIHTNTYICRPTNTQFGKTCVYEKKPTYIK